ncbi:MAG: HD domain-containing phosphohydrolase, partial [Planctomycetaceae bacterium]
MDSSRILLDLLMLSNPGKRSANESEAPSDLDGIISPDVFRRLLTTLHYRDVATVRHSRRVALMCVAMAKFLGWEARSLKILEVAALLHDIGKIGVPDNILYKPGKLNPDEAHLMTLHYNITQTVLQACRADHNVLDIIGHVQNRYQDNWNRVSTDSPLGSRLLAVADAYDSMSNEQVYRPKMPHETIMKVLNNASGTQFDGNVVQALSRWLDAEGRQFFQQSQEQQVRATNHGPTTPGEALEASNLCRIFSYLHLLESMYDGYYIVDPKLNFQIWNRGMETLLGRQDQTVLRQNWSAHPISYADAYGNSLPHRNLPVQRVLGDGKSFTGECSIQHADGQWIRVEVQCTPIWDQANRLRGIAEIYRNLSRSSSHHEQFIRRR